MLEYGATIVTNYDHAANLGPENLLTNLDERINRYSLSTNTNGVYSCWAPVVPSGEPLVATFHFPAEVLVNAVFLAGETLWGLLGTRSNSDYAKFAAV